MPLNWFTGDVATAVAEAKQRQASLIVFVKSDDEYTKIYEEVLNTVDTSNKWYIAITLQAYSTEYEQLKAIYKVVPVPSVLVIDWENGMVMERIAGPLFDEELQEMFLDALVNMPAGQKQKENTPVRDPTPPAVAVPPAQAKIQFKLGTENKMKVFEATDTLATIRTEVKALFDLRHPFELAIPYPRRVLEADSDSATLLDLGLCPASSVLVIPQQPASVIPWSFLQQIGGIFQPLIDFIVGLWQRIFGGAAPPPPPAQGSSDKKRN